ncbi:MAG: primosomal protein N', partial [Bacteroidota bacterium]
MSGHLFADVILPVAIDRRLTYRIPLEMLPHLSEGMRVVAPLGRSKLYSGIVYRIHSTPPDTGKVKDLITVLDETPIVAKTQFDFWDWIADYYLCSPGDVMNCAIPSGLRLQSETFVALHENFNLEAEILDEYEEGICALLSSKGSASVEDIQKLFPGIAAQKRLKRLLDKGIVLVSEEITERYRPLQEARLRLKDGFKDDKKLESVFNKLESDTRKHKQLDALMRFLQLSYDEGCDGSVKKKDLLRNEIVSSSSVQSLVKAGILEEFTVHVDRLPFDEVDVEELSALSDIQSKALGQIKHSWNSHDTVLLHGVTSSGKTEIYLHLIMDAVNRGKQVLYLLPEIALTSQIIRRLRRFLGNQVGVYHSKFTSNERVELWNRISSHGKDGLPSSPLVILGARSALFLPFKDLGLVIVDEEHDASYKQMDPAPRYNARDAAIMLARQQGAKVVLGSATPSVESYFNAEQGRFGLVQLTERYGGILLPEIVLSDIREATRKKLMQSHFSPLILDSIRHALESKEQVILFQNRRGFSPYLECRTCNWIPHCRNCSVTLTYHKQSKQMKCHYCGYAEPVATSCPQCGEPDVAVKGFGTEKVEEEIGVFFPEHSIARLDLDTARTRTSFHRIISDFEEGAVDVLVGTQMVSKGLDFDHVSTVCILDADQSLNFPDFRAHERSFQLLAQVSGRSGRKNKRGKVIIQTRQPDHWVLRDVIENDFKAFYERDLLERKQFGYPPHSRLIELTIRHRDETMVHEASSAFADMLKIRLGNRVFGPHIPLVSRIRNYHMRNILLRISRDEQVAEVKRLLKETIRAFVATGDWTGVQI